MRPRLLHVGTGAHPIVVVDDFCGEVASIVDTAAALAPFPAAQSAYPGLRRVIGDNDGAAMAYVTQALERAAPYIAGAYDCDRFELIEASFSLVTTQPHALHAEQRAPHFDSLDPHDLAVMHYLAPTAGTAFFRQRATGIDYVTDASVAAFVKAARQRDGRLAGYVDGQSSMYERVAVIEGLVDRLAIYPGALLHSGIIDDLTNFSPDPRRGRLTANIFVRLKR